MTPERERPDIEHTREALRRHDERVEEDEQLEEEEEAAAEEEHERENGNDAG
jgi:hypothetical protein